MIHKTKIVFILSLIYLAGAGAAFSFMTLEVDRVGSILEGRVLVIANRYAQEKKFVELNELVLATESERDFLTDYILSESDTISFLAEIERIGSEQGVALSTNSLKATENLNAPNELEVIFSIVGSKDLVFRMLTILESLPYENEVSYLTLAVGEETKMDITLRLTLF